MTDPKQKRPSIGVALSGGAARGFAHIGALQVLHEAGIPIDFIMGTSVGSVIGAAYASGTPFDTMREVCASMRWADIARLRISKRGLASIDRSDAFLARLIRARRFEELRTRFYAVATDLRTGEVVVLSRGDLHVALHASCAVPGLFMPVEYQGRLLVDGGVSSNLPVLPLRQLGVEKIILVDVSSRIDEQQPPENMIQILVQSMFIIGRTAARVARDHADVVVQPAVGGFGWDDFKHCDEIARAGETAMRHKLREVQAFLPGAKITLFQKVRSLLRRPSGA